MIEYVRMNDDNINDVVVKYNEYYNNFEDGCWDYNRAYKRIHQILSMDASLCYLQYENNELVGFLMGYYKEYDDILAFYIEEIVIFANHQNQGLGQALIKKVESEVISYGAKHTELISVNDEHHRHFYEKLGFYYATNLVLMAKHFY